MAHGPSAAAIVNTLASALARQARDLTAAADRLRRISATVKSPLEVQEVFRSVQESVTDTQVTIASTAVLYASTAFDNGYADGYKDGVEDGADVVGGYDDEEAGTKEGA